MPDEVVIKTDDPPKAEPSTQDAAFEHGRQAGRYDAHMSETNEKIYRLESKLSDLEAKLADAQRSSDMAAVTAVSADITATEALIVAAEAEAPAEEPIETASVTELEAPVVPLDEADEEPKKKKPFHLWG